MQRSYLRMVRKNRMLTIRSVATKLGIDESYLAKIERGVHDPSYKIAVRLGKFYGIEMEKLLRKDGE